MFERLPAGAAVFLDANVLIYHAVESRPSCALLLRRIATREIRGYTSTVVLSEVFHRLVLSEIAVTFRLPSARAALNLVRRHPEHLPALTVAHQFLAKMPTLRIRVLPVRWREITLAMAASRRYGLLANDALIIATMQAHRLTHLASNDADFRRVPTITLWRP